MASQSPLPQSTDPSFSIISTVGVTPAQTAKGSEVGTHTGPIFTVPVAVAVQPSELVQVMVYTQ